MKSKLDTGVDIFGANHKCSTWGNYKCLWSTKECYEAGNFCSITGNSVNTEADRSLVYLWFTAFCFLVAWAAVRADNKDAKKHREFLSEILGREILNFDKWCEKQGIDKSKYWEDRTVNSAYRSYLIQAEQEANKKLARG